MNAIMEYFVDEYETRYSTTLSDEDLEKYVVSCIYVYNSGCL